MGACSLCVPLPSLGGFGTLPCNRKLATPGPVAVIGTTGKVGRMAVEALVSKGYKARCLCRHHVEESAMPDGAPGADPASVLAYLASLPDVTLVKGDVTDKDSLAALLKGASACLALHGARRTRKLTDLLPWVDPTSDPAHAKNVNYEGVRNILEAAKASGTCRRVVRLTGKGETPVRLGD